MRLLVVEDEEDLADAVGRGLRRDGHAVDVTYDGCTAYDQAVLYDYDLVCLDLTLPCLDGVELCRRLLNGTLGPERPTPRVLMLTARDSVADRVRGLDAGADDYLVKPFDFAELAARVRALLRRPPGRAATVLHVGDLTLDPARHLATRRGEALDLTAKELELLRYLMVNAGLVLSRDQLLEHVWDANADPLTNTVRVTVGTLRRKLEQAGHPQPIETVVGVGYRLRPVA